MVSASLPIPVSTLAAALRSSHTSLIKREIRTPLGWALK